MTGLTKNTLAGLAAAEHLLAVIGWTITAVEVDSSRGQLDITLTRHDGRRVHLRATQERAILERWQARAEFRVPRGRSGMVPRVDCVEYEFLGRQQFTGAQSAMRHLAAYVEDNATKALPGAGRAALRPLLAEYLRLVA